jgi:2-methylcitrate dehydratase PrpD
MNTATGLTMALAERISATRWDDLSNPARTVAKQCLLDFIGVTLAGAREPLATMLNAEAQDAGGNPQATLIGCGRRASVDQAALINGAAGHAHDYDDVHMAMNGHPTVPVAPRRCARLLLNITTKGKESLAAFAAGVDAECIIGRHLGASHYAEGWHATESRQLRRRAAAANLLGLDAEAPRGRRNRRHASGRPQSLAPCKPLHAGHAAAVGVQAARLAARGHEPRRHTETPQGLPPPRPRAPPNDSIAR